MTRSQRYAARGGLFIFLGGLLVVALPGEAHAQATKTAPAAKKPPAAKKSPAPNTSAFKTASQPFVASGCDKSLWSHVYHKDRLMIIQDCIEVTGTIHHTKKEHDGDDHIQLRVDPQFSNLLNDRNKSVQAGSLVIEPICMGLVTQPDAMPACRDFHSPVRSVPADGTRVKVLGSYVWDNEGDHGWTEIHPVTSISAM